MRCSGGIMAVCCTAPFVLGLLPSPMVPPSTDEALWWCLACTWGSLVWLRWLLGGRSRGTRRLRPVSLRVRLLPAALPSVDVGLCLGSVCCGLPWWLPYVLDSDGLLEGWCRSSLSQWGDKNSLVLPHSWFRPGSPRYYAAGGTVVWFCYALCRPSLVGDSASRPFCEVRYVGFGRYLEG